MTVSTDVAAVTTSIPLPTAPRVRTQGVPAKPKGRAGGKHPHQDLPAVAELRVRLAAFEADGGLELVKSWVEQELKKPLPDDATIARRYGFNQALLIGEAKVSVERLRQRWQMLALEFGDELEQVVRKPWIRRVAATSTDPVALGRAMNAAENLAAEYRQRSTNDEVERLLADGGTSRWHVLETRRSTLWVDNEHLIREDEDSFGWVRTMKTPIRPGASERQLDAVERAIGKFEAFIKRCTETPARVRGGGRRGNAAARARSRERNAEIEKLRRSK